MKIRRGAALVCAALAALTMSAIQAQASPATHTDGKAPRFCSTLIDDSVKDEAAPVLAQYCTDTSRADADAGLRREAAKQGQSIQADQALLILWELTGYRGNSNVIQGKSGKCDRDGYQLTLNTYWQVNISSVQGIATCDRLLLHRRFDNVAKTFNLDCVALTDNYNNNINFRARVYSSYYG